MLLFLLHHVDRLAHEKDIPQNVRITIRDELVHNLIDKEILPYKIVLKLVEDGIKPSLDAFGVPHSL